MQLLDQTKNMVRLKEVPKRIVSVVPSQTELLFDLGLENEVVGITKFCVHPEKWQSQKAIIGGTKNLNIRQILDLEPDLIIANKEENRKIQVEKLKSFCPVYISDVIELSDALEMITDIGRMCDKQAEADKIALDIEVKLDNFKVEKQHKKESVAYLIWRDPFMVAGGDTFINNFLEWAEWENVFSQIPRYPKVTLDDLIQAAPDRILLSSEPYNFTDEDIPYFKQILPLSKIELVDGERFSWYGSRMKHAPAYIYTVRQA